MADHRASFPCDSSAKISSDTAVATSSGASSSTPTLSLPLASQIAASSPHNKTHRRMRTVVATRYHSASRGHCPNRYRDGRDAKCWSASATSNAPPVAMGRDLSPARPPSPNATPDSITHATLQALPAAGALAKVTSAYRSALPPDPAEASFVFDPAVDPESSLSDSESEASSYVHSPLATPAEESSATASALGGVATSPPSGTDHLSASERRDSGDPSFFADPPGLLADALRSHDDLALVRAEIEQRKKARRSGSFLSLERPISLGFTSGPESPSDTAAILKELREMRAEMRDLRNLVQEMRAGCHCQREAQTKGTTECRLMLRRSLAERRLPDQQRV